MKQIVLDKDWGRYRAGTQLDVLGPGDEFHPNAVDAQRAAALLASRLASPAKAEEPEGPASKKAAKSGKGKA